MKLDLYITLSGERNMTKKNLVKLLLDRYSYWNKSKILDQELKDLEKFYNNKTQEELLKYI